MGRGLGNPHINDARAYTLGNSPALAHPCACGHPVEQDRRALAPQHVKPDIIVEQGIGRWSVQPVKSPSIVLPSLQSSGSIPGTAGSAMPASHFMILDCFLAIDFVLE